MEKLRFIGFQRPGVIFCLLLSVVCYSYAKEFTSEDQQKLRLGIEKTIKTVIPDGEGPFPTVVIFSGAGKPTWRKGYENWMQFLSREGYASVFFDSAKARRKSPDAMFGRGLLPRVRAADAFLIIDILQNYEFVDLDKIVFMGMSHGGDTILDALVLSDTPDKIDQLPNFPERMLEGLRGVIAFYPGCREPIMKVRITENYDTEWKQKNIPVVIFQGGNDLWVDEPLCQAVVERQQKIGTPIEYYFYPKIPHCFDENYGSDAKCRMNKEASQDAKEKVKNFLSRIL